MNAVHLALVDFSGYERNIDRHVRNLRRKLRELLPDWETIRSIYGVGYGLDASALETPGARRLTRSPEGAA